MSSPAPVRDTEHSSHAAVEAAVAALQLDYAVAIDEDELERWPEFFTEQCLYRIVPRRDYQLGRRASLFVCDSKGMLKDRVSAIRRVNVFEPHRYRHIISAPKIVKATKDSIEAYSGYIVVRTTQNRGMDVFSAGSYRDEFVYDGGALKFKSRCVVCDSEEIDTLLSLPL
jgi:anthranilate 1,2-dioxygenase small subunit